MSLKERLNKEIKKEDIKPVAPKDNFEFNSLGILDLLLSDNQISSIFVSNAKNIFIEKNKKITKSTATFRDNVQLENLIKKTANDLGIKLDKNNPFFKFNHKLGINVLMTLPPLSNTGTIKVKCYRDFLSNFNNFVEEKSLSKEMAILFETLSYLGGNIIIAGKKGTLKTSFLSALIKKIPQKEKGVVIDYKEEIKPEASNLTTYDFSFLENLETKKQILDTIFSFSPSKIFVNDPELDLKYYLDYLLEGFSGFVFTLEANSREEAIIKVAKTIQKNKPELTLEEAKEISYKIFNLIIFASQDDEGKSKISHFSEINQNGEMKDVFRLSDFNEHISTGFIPSFYSQIKEFLSSNLFEIGYKHTYSNKTNQETKTPQLSKKNVDILKKFKKKPVEVEQKVEEEEIFDNSFDTDLDIDNIDIQTLDEVLENEKSEKNFDETLNEQENL